MGYIGRSKGICRTCKYVIRIRENIHTSVKTWYCTNEKCEHAKGEDVIDHSIPEWAQVGNSGMFYAPFGKLL